MDTSSIGSVNDTVVSPAAPPPVSEAPKEEERPPENISPEPAEDSGKTIDLYV
jgi:hypothetical protein